MFKGEVEIVKIDKKTNKELERKKYYNKTSIDFDIKFLSLFDSPSLISNNQFINTIILYTDNVPDINKYSMFTLTHDTKTIRNGALQYKTFYDTSNITTNGPYIEFKVRFDPAASDRTINAVMLSGDDFTNNTSSYISTYLNLTPACVQSTTEILDVYYRLYFDMQLLQYNNLVTLDSYVWSYPRTFYDNGTLHVGTPQEEFVYNLKYNSNIADNFNYLLNNGIHTSLGRLNSDYMYRSRNVYKNFALTDNVGEWINGLCFGNNETVSSFANINNQDLPGGYLQPIHNHSSTSNIPFLDVDNLATSQGTLKLSTNTTDDLPTFYRLQIKRTGDIGTSSYHISRRKALGFSGNSYTEKGVVIPFLKITPGTYENEMFFYKKPIYGADYRAYNIGSTQYNALNFIESIIGETSTGELVLCYLGTDQGFTIFDILTGEYTSFDKNLYSAFDVTSPINDIDIDDNDIIWVATNSGLYKIENWNALSPITPSITKYNDANGLNYSIAYKVTIGAGNIVYALVDGGLIRTNDAGTSWSYYNDTTTPAFSFVGLTDNNWHQSRILAANKVIQDELAILVNDPNVSSGSYKLFWWNISGVSSQGATTMSGYEPPTFNKRMLRTDTKKGIWIATELYDNGTGFYSYRASAALLKFNSTSVNPRGHLSASNGSCGYQNGACLLYDYYDQPYLISSPTENTLPRTAYSSPYYNIFSSHMDINRYAKNVSFAKHSTGSSVYHIVLYTFEKNHKLKNNILVYEYFYSDEPMVKLLTPSGNRGYYTGIPNDEFTWDNYTWNGSQWVKNYYQPAQATDAAGVAVPADNAPRHNFDVEDHRFTGRSMIDISAPYGNKNSTGNMTFVASVIPEDKPANAFGSLNQSPISTLFSYTDNSTNTKFSFYWNKANTYADITFNDGVTDYSFGIAPADNILHRVVLSIDTTNNIARCYVDGVQLGTDVSFTNPINLTNPNGSAKVYIGADIFRRFDYEFIEDFYKGQMSNVQIWDGLWTSTDVTNDYGNTAGVITPSAQAGNMLLRYELNETLNETKLTHTTQQNLIDGITNYFQAGTVSPDFVSGDYYTFIVSNGVFKDNATSFTFDKRIYLKPVDILTDIEDNVNAPGSTAPVTIPSTGGIATEKMAFTTPNTTVNIPPRYYKVYGAQSSAFSGNYNYFKGRQSFSGDFDIDFKLFYRNTNSNSGGLYQYVSIEFDDPSTDTSTANIFKIYFKAGETVTFNVNDNNTFPYIYNNGDVIRIQRVSGSITIYHNGTAIYSTSNASTLMVNFTAANSYGSSYKPNCLIIYDVNIQYDRPAGFLDFGNSIAQTGRFYPNFYRIDKKGLQINIDGVPAIITINDDLSYQRLHEIPEPNPGEVIVMPDMGLMKFSSADYGKTVTAQYVAIYDER